MMIDEEKVQTLKQSLKIEDQKCLDLLVSNLQYFSSQEILKGVEKSLDKFFYFYQNKFFVLLPKEKWGSEHWITSHFYTKIASNPYFQSIVYSLDDVPDNSTIILLDDGIYSGNNMTHLIDTRTYELAKKLKKKQRECKFEFVCLTALSTNNGLKAIEENIRSILGRGKITIYANSIIKTISEIFPLDFDWKIYNKLIHVTLPEISGKIKYLEKILENADKAAYDPTLVYLEHKIPNQFGSIPQLLEIIVKSPPNRQIIENCPRPFYFIDSLEED